MAKRIETSLYFEARFPVKGKVLQAILCECEKEGELRVRAARDPTDGWEYNPEDKATFVDIHAFDPKGTYLKVRPGEWAAGDVICFGYLQRSKTKTIEMDGEVLTSGSLKVGQVAVADDGVTVDFGLFTAELRAETPEELEKILAREKLKGGSFVETDCDVDVELRRWGPKELILREPHGKQGPSYHG